MEITEKILGWYYRNKRDLPWRLTRDPYKIWLSEVILQQTRVDQGLPYYQKFVKRFPTVRNLASASEPEVLKLWQGLGYYSRARNLHAAAKQIMKEHKGVFPKTHEEILALKGVGDYTAAAIASFAFDLSYPVVDGNVLRLMSRLFGIRKPVDEIKTRKKIREICATLLKGYPPHDFNQAIMEFGSVVCKPANPVCTECPLMDSCVAFEKKIVAQLPVKTPKASSRNRYFNYLIIRDGSKLYLRQRKENDIWKNLYEFPSIETRKHSSVKALANTTSWIDLFGKTNNHIHKISETDKHLLSHQVLHIRFLELMPEIKMMKKFPGDWKLVPKSSLKKYAVPKPVEKQLLKLL